MRGNGTASHADIT